MSLAPIAIISKNVYYFRDPYTGKPSNELGWKTTPRTKEFMFQTMMRNLPNMQVYDEEFISQCRNIRIDGDKVLSVGADDIHDATAIALVCNDPTPVKKGFAFSSGFRW